MKYFPTVTTVWMDFTDIMVTEETLDTKDVILDYSTKSPRIGKDMMMMKVRTIDSMLQMWLWTGKAQKRLLRW